LLVTGAADGADWPRRRVGALEGSIGLDEGCLLGEDGALEGSADGGVVGCTLGDFDGA